MKNFLIGFLVLLLWGCKQSVEVGQNPIIPPQIILQNAEETDVGFAVPVGDEIFVTVDHLLDFSETLFHDSAEAEVIARDFDRDLLVFKLDGSTHNPSTPDKQNVSPLKKGEKIFADSPPGMDGEVFWLDGQEIRREKVISLSEFFHTNGQVKRNLIAISGTAETGKSGAPIFDQNGKIFGLLVGSNKEKNITFVTRSDFILDFLAKNVDE